LERKQGEENGQKKCAQTSKKLWDSIKGSREMGKLACSFPHHPGPAIAISEALSPKEYLPSLFLLGPVASSSRLGCRAAHNIPRPPQGLYCHTIREQPNPVPFSSISKVIIISKMFCPSKMNPETPILFLNRHKVSYLPSLRRLWNLHCWNEQK
jgi:hypothetical protein